MRLSSNGFVQAHAVFCWKGLWAWPWKPIHVPWPFLVYCKVLLSLDFSTTIHMHVSFLDRSSGQVRVFRWCVVQACPFILWDDCGLVPWKRKGVESSSTAFQQVKAMTGRGSKTEANVTIEIRSQQWKSRLLFNTKDFTPRTINVWLAIYKCEIQELKKWLINYANFQMKKNLSI